MRVLEVLWGGGRPSVLLLCWLGVSSAFAGILGLEYQEIDLDSFIVEQRPLTPGTRTILKPSGVAMLATVMSEPEKRDVKYLYTALQLMQVTPIPKVNHRMFIRTSEGQVIAVYVEDAGVDLIRRELDPGDQVRFHGYHVYNYSKGPALVIEGFSKP
jgi:hypothetical protein